MYSFIRLSLWQVPGSQAKLARATKEFIDSFTWEDLLKLGVKGRAVGSKASGNQRSGALLDDLSVCLFLLLLTTWSPPLLPHTCFLFRARNLGTCSSSLGRVGEGARAACYQREMRNHTDGQQSPCCPLSSATWQPRAQRTCWWTRSTPDTVWDLGKAGLLQDTQLFGAFTHVPGASHKDEVTTPWTCSWLSSREWHRLRSFSPFTERDRKTASTNQKQPNVCQLMKK